MTNKLAVVLGAIIFGVVALDLLIFGWDLHIFLGRKLGELSEYIAFWR